MTCRGCGENEQYQGVPDPISEHYWFGNGLKGFWSIMKPYAASVTNACLNPSVEADANGWAAINAATVFRSNDGALHGNLGMQVFTTVANQGVGYDMYTQFSTNTPYSACVSIDGPAGSVATFNFEFSTGPGGMTASTPNRVTLPGYPVRVCCSLAPQSSGPVLPTLLVSVRFDRAGEYKVDGLVITTTTTPITSYFDGDSLDASWNGEAHKSSSSTTPFSRTLGERVNLNEIGFNVVGSTGFGLTTKTLLTTSFARLNGAHLQRVKDEPRTITITGLFEGNPSEMHQTRQALIDALTYRFKNQCTQELILCYALHDECGCQVSQELQIPVEYQAGLEGMWTTLDRERATLVFVANTEQSWSEWFDRSVDLTHNGTDIIVNEGDDDAWIELHVWPGGAGISISELHNETTGHSIYFGSAQDGNPTTMPVPLNSYVILRNDPARRVSLDRYLIDTVAHTTTVTRAMQYIRYPQSQLGLFRLVPGENQIRNVLTADSGGSRLFIKWRNKFQSADTLCAGQCWG